MNMTASDIGLISAAGAQACATVALVIVTWIYVRSARKMAKEIQNQRYDTFRPVIYIEDVNAKEGPVLQRVNNRVATDEEKISSNPFECVLRNYGAGVAIDVYAFPLSQQRIGSIQAKESKDIGHKSNVTDYITARKIGDQWFLVAYYRDVYDRCFESKRSVNLEGEGFKYGPLKHRKLDKQKDSALINEIWPP